jgi:hypothetical protein
MPSVRRLTAILAADVAGYSRLMGVDEEGTHERLKAHLVQLVDPKIKEHRGRTVKNTGDRLLAEFASVVAAVHCAAEISADDRREPEATDERQIRFRIGVNPATSSPGRRHLRRRVNVAARREALAGPADPSPGRADRARQADFASRTWASGRSGHFPASAGLCVALEAVADLPAASALATSVAVCRSAAPLDVVLPFANLSNDPEQSTLPMGSPRT